jgi:hypothetical protein
MGMDIVEADTMVGMEATIITLVDMAGMDMEVDMGEEAMDGMDENKKIMTYCRTKMDNQVKWTVTEEFKILLDVL